MGLRNRQSIFAYNIACLIHYAFDNLGIELTFGEAYRTKSQMILNFYGFEVTGGTYSEIDVSKSKKLSNTLESLHGDRLAVDFNFFIDDKLTYKYEDIKPLGDYWESLHPKNRWGGDFNKNDKEDGFVDVPHFEMQK